MTTVRSVQPGHQLTYDDAPVIRRSVSLLLAIVLFAPSGWGQSDPALDQARREYQALKARRDETIAELQELWKRLDAAAPPGMDESSIRARRSTNEQDVREKEAVLAAILERARELRAILHEPAGPAASSDAGKFGQGKLAGRWALRLDEHEGSIEAVQLGAFLSGTYDVSGLGQGTFIGYGGGKVVLTLIDDRGDHVATLRSDSLSDDRMSGTWLRTDLAGGLPTQGDWSATR